MKFTKEQSEEAARLARNAFANVLVGMGTWNIVGTEEEKERWLTEVTNLSVTIGIEAVRRIGFSMEDTIASKITLPPKAAE